MRGIGLVPELEGLVDDPHPEPVLPDGRPGLAPLEREEPEPIVLLAVGIEVGEHRGEGDAAVPVLEPADERQLTLPRQGVAEPRVHAGEVVLVVVELAAEVEPAHAEGVAPRPRAAGDAGAPPERLVVAGLEIHEPRRGSLPALGDDVDHAPDRVGAVERRLRAPQDLDPLDIVEREVGEVEVAGRGALDPHAVDQDLHLGRVGAANADGGELPRAARRLHLHAGDGPQRLLDRPVLLGAHLFLGLHRHRRAGLFGRLLAPRGGHDDRVGSPDFRAGGGDAGGGRACRSESGSARPPAPLRGPAASRACTTRLVASSFRISSRTPLPRRGVGLVRPDRSPDSWLFASAAPSQGDHAPVTSECGGRSPLTVAGQCRILTGFPCIGTLPQNALPLTSIHRGQGL